MRDLRIESLYQATPAEVWQAITDPEELAAWLMENDFKPELGHEFQFRTKPQGNFDGIVDCKVLEIVPEQRLRYSWSGGGQHTIVTWELHREGAATRLVLTQTGFAGFGGLFVGFILGSGWKKKFRTDLRARIEGGRTG